MKYKLSSDGDPRTDSYMFTVTSKDDPNLIALKADVALHNKKARENQRYYYERTGKKSDYYPIQRVTLMARGPRAVHSMNDFGYSYAYDQSLPHKYATSFDVYRGTDSHNQNRFNYELEAGLTPGQHAAIDKANQMVWEAEFKALEFLGSKKIRKVHTQNGTEYRGE